MNDNALAEKELVQETALTGVAALLEEVYNDPNFAAASSIRYLVSRYLPSTRVMVSAQLVDDRVFVATDDAEIPALRQVLHRVAKHIGMLDASPAEVSVPGRRLIAEREGLRLEAYKDVGGLWTIGYGHLLTPSELTSGKIEIDGKTVKWGEKITEIEADQLLRQDLERFEDGVSLAINVPLSQCQYDALVSLAFNIGVDAFRKSTLARRLRAKEYEAVPEEMARWVYVAGRKRHGLIKRRKEEAKQWSGMLT